MIEIKIDESHSKQRVDKFLAEYFEDKNENLTRNQIQKLINEDLVLVNKNTTSSNYRLKADDLIEILKVKTEKKEEKNVLKKLGFDITDIIVEETDDYIVLNKPAGIIVHDFDSVNEETLVDVLLERYPEIRQIGEDPARPGIVHRIDREVSGLMVVARNQKSFDSLKEQFKKRTVKKYYQALVYGHIAKDNDEIRFPITRSRSRYKMAALPKTNRGEKQTEGKIAISEFDVIKRFINYTLLKVKIKTGRTHQIRVHLAAYGNPIVGDDVYTTNKLRDKNKKKNLGRIFLVAYYLSFDDLSGKNKEFEIKLPNGLDKFLKQTK